MSGRARPIFVAEPPQQYLARLPIVVDSSMVCAVLFDEPERTQAEHRLLGRHLLAPRLLDYEVVSVAVKKFRRGMPGPVVERALADYRAQGIEFADTAADAQFALAQRYELSSYDAAYLWLAAALKVPLATFDRKLGVAAQAHLSSLE